MTQEFECRGCGACCLHLGTPPAGYPEYASPSFSGVPFMGEDADYKIWLTMPEEVKQLLRDKYASEYDQDEGPCLFFDTELLTCKHYEYRPEACREAVIPGDESCLAFRQDRDSALIQLGLLKR